jgi:hypothetical protein
MRLPVQANLIVRAINTARILDGGIVSRDDSYYNLPALPGGVISMILAETNPTAALIDQGLLVRLWATL